MHYPLCVLCLLLVLLPALPAQGPQVPAGFVDEEVANAGLTRTTGLAFLPDGRLIVTERHSGELKLVINGAVSVIGIVPNVDTPPGEQGLMAVEVDPQWPGRPYLYVLYTSASPENVRVSMFPVSGDLSDPSSTNLTLGSEYLIIADAPDTHINHNGGKCRFGPGGSLFVSLGDDGDPCGAQDTGILVGKVLRLDVSGLPLAGSGPPPKAMIAAAGNPLAGTNDQLVWAYGFRNPYSFHVDYATGNLFIADVGAGAREEIDHCTAGGQELRVAVLGRDHRARIRLAMSPRLEPPRGPARRIQPWTCRPGGHLHGAVPEPPRRRHRLRPGLRGRLLLCRSPRRRPLRLERNGASFAPPVSWAAGLSLPTDAAVGPDGALYYTRGPWTGGSVRRIRRDLPPASVTLVGSGCAGTSGTPLTLAGSGLPALGNLGFGLTVSSGPPSGSISLFFSTGLAATPIPLAGSCLIYLDLSSAFALVAAGVSPFDATLDPTGSTTYAIPIPSAPELGGVAVDFQVVGLDPLGPGGFVTSNGLSVVIGL